MDLLISVLPRYTTWADPPAGVSIIKSAATQAGFKAKAVDFNLIFYQETWHKDQELWKEIDYWMDQVPQAPFNNRVLSDRAQQELDRIFDIWLDIIQEHQPKYLGLGIFTSYSIRPALLFIPKVKQRFPHIKIILGGAGTSPKNHKLYRIADYYVQGEGEQAIVDILNGDSDQTPGVNENPIQQIDDLDQLPWPDYSDYPLDEYERKGKMIRINGSRGCIRRCNFCDVYKIWTKFRYRSGSNIADEMFHQWKTLPTQPDTFIFTDSLINGNMDMLRDTCKHLIKYRQDHPQFNPKFKGQFIAASPNFITDDDWDLLKDAGCHTLYVGVESGSERVRYKMNKKVKQEWLYHCIEQAHKRNIFMRWFVIIGYPEETDEDFLETVELCRKYKWMNAGDWRNEQYQINVSINTFLLYDVDWVADHEDEIHYSSDIPGEENSWTWEGNPELGKSKRMARHIYLHKKMMEWNYDYRVTSWMNYIQEFDNLENILIERYGEQVFGNYYLYKKYLKLIEQQHQELINK